LSSQKLPSFYEKDEKFQGIESLISKNFHRGAYRHRDVPPKYKKKKKKVAKFFEKSEFSEMYDLLSFPKLLKQIMRGEKYDI
jgi:hypothetical protein